MASAKRGRLLIVDDEAELRFALCETLADEGFETTGAASGAEGLRLLEGREFDLLLSDLMMPGMDGIQLLKKALEVDPQLVGVIMTGQGTIQTKSAPAMGRKISSEVSTGYVTRMKTMARTARPAASARAYSRT